MADITIPDEALERVARKLAMLCEDGTENWQDYLFDANDLCLAMLKAWPGVLTGANAVGTKHGGGTGTATDAIVLPLPLKETSA